MPTCRMKSSSTAVAAQMLKLRTAGIGVREPSPNASTSQLAASVMDGPAEPRARPARVTRGNVGSCSVAAERSHISEEGLAMVVCATLSLRFYRLLLA
jgi:hypothetical protein